MVTNTTVRPPYEFSWKKIPEVLREDGIVDFTKAASRYVAGRIRLWWLRRGTKKTTAITRVQQTLMYTNPHDPGLGSELIVRGIREKHSTRELQRSLKPGMTVIDLGSNIGYYVLQECRAIGPNGRVLAIEPVKDNFETLAKNIELNGYSDRVRAHQVAIGATCGTARMGLSAFSNRHSFISRDPREARGSIDVPLLTFSAFLERAQLRPNEIDLIRMDIEGYEAEVIPDLVERMREAGKRFRVFIELHPGKIEKLPGRSFRQLLECFASIDAVIDWTVSVVDGKKVFIRNQRVVDLLREKHLPRISETWLTVN